jgi:hypothetical protein
MIDWLEPLRQDTERIRQENIKIREETEKIREETEKIREGNRKFKEQKRKLDRILEDRRIKRLIREVIQEIKDEETL